MFQETDGWKYCKLDEHHKSQNGTTNILPILCLVSSYRGDGKVGGSHGRSAKSKHRDLYSRVYVMA